ncbi:L-tyrosine/L-tryptophan isonitrile synthase family protein [Thalassomonas viridans]|uniref:L-tyrosine/L-tryptophan isonitrile synthase family protein n=1 Tax=Thalassomonas viridans TaxID=137584 RepID=A0AAF0CAJ9_9GAMM|nr:L-tyrosine/L-tryptophan isonitrile synthase family protein [Thalassomonas viridans]WDE05954.1 L-tyrosine/L-tryptophan isonitrile synthase family protein [Thalassomonas viridans]
MVNCILFDLDGTLIDTLTDITNAMNRTFLSFGLPPQPLSVYRKLIGGGSKNMVETLVPEGLDKQRIFAHYLLEYEQHSLVETRPYPGVHQALRQFQQMGLKLVVVTNKHHHQAVSLLTKLFPDIHFHAVQGVVEDMPKKPHPQMALTALAQTACRAQKCLFVGDTATDMKTAQAAGISSVYVSWGYGALSGSAEMPDGRSADFTITNISQLADLVQASKDKEGRNMKTIAGDEGGFNKAAMAEQLLPVIQSYLVADEQDKFNEQGAALLLGQLIYFIEKDLPLEFILPGFPCKSPNDVDKSFSVMPDYGEVRAIERLDEFAGRLNGLYAPGCRVTILSDGTTFSDIVCVAEEDKEAYKAALRKLTVTENICWADLSSLLEPGKSNAAALSCQAKRKALVNLVAPGPRAFEKFVAKVQGDSEQAGVHDKLCSYLYHDIHLERFSEGDRDTYLESISEKAYQMMYRGRALSYGIEQAFPHHIRLSVHQYDNAGPKFTFALTDHQQKSISPWHTVPVRLLNGQYLQLPHSLAKEKLLAKVTLGEHNWLYLEVPASEFSDYGYQVIKGPKFGLKISAPAGKGYEIFSADLLQQLSEEFGFVVLSQAGFEQQDQLVDFCQAFGDIYQWQFGPVHVVKPEENPDGFVHSIEKTPLHWDLSMLPAGDKYVEQNPWFAASTFMLYCKTPPAAGEGQTTLVDSRMALKIAGQEKVNLWRETEITYETKMTYFGGVPRAYPLVFEHPKTGEDIFRYQEGSELEMQKFLLSSDSLSGQALEDLIADVNAIAYDERCLVAHEWQAGDLVIIDNYYTLHGRLAMSEKSMSRELWRVQCFN